MDIDDSFLNNAKFDSNAIPKNIPNDTLENVDDMSMRQQRKERFSQDTRFRRHLANWVMIIVPAWLMSVVVLIYLHGYNTLDLDKEVLITLLATTTVNVLGLAYIVLKGIFPKNQNSILNEPISVGLKALNGNSQRFYRFFYVYI